MSKLEDTAFSAQLVAVESYELQVEMHISKLFIGGRRRSQGDGGCVGHCRQREVRGNDQNVLQVSTQLGCLHKCPLS